MMRMNRNKIRKLFIAAIACIAIGGIGVYAYHQSAEFVRGPTITVTAPKNGATVEKQFIEIRGSARNISYLSLNGRQIYTDQEQVFREKLLLSPGYNIITIEAADKFDRNTTEILEVVYQSQEST